MSFLRFLKKLLGMHSRAPRSLDRVSLADGGFTVRCGTTEPFAVAWPEVTEVVAYKQDALTTDLVCLAFTLSDGRSFVLHDEMAGFWSVADELQERLPGIPSNWEGRVVAGPFHENKTQLYPSG